MVGVRGFNMREEVTYEGISKFVIKVCLPSIHLTKGFIVFHIKMNKRREQILGFRVSAR